MRRVADVVAEWIADAGVTDVFLLPGGGAMYLNDGVACESRLRPVPCHHEQACGIAAEAYGRVHPSRFGVAMVTTGPGATNVLTPVAGAWIESLPLMVIAGQVKQADALNGRPLRQSGVQEVDVLSMVKPLTKFATRLNDPKKVLSVLDEARYKMLSGRPGPVWVDIPLDTQAAPVDVKQLERWQPAPGDNKSKVSSDSLSELEQLLANAERPLILAGHGVRIAGAAEAFVSWAESLGVPCVFTWNAADLLPWDHELYVGRPGVVAARAPNFAVQNCDLLIAVGARLDNIVTAYSPRQFARAAKKVVVDVDRHELEKNPFEALGIRADAGDFLNAWVTGGFAVKREWSTWISTCQDWKSRFLPGDRRDGEAASDPVTHIEFVEALSKLVPEDTLLITGSSGLAVEFFYTAFRNKEGQRFFLTSGLGAMGYGLAAAIGACIGSGAKPTLCIESDGSLMLNLQELATLKTHNLPIAVVVMNNGGYASIRNTQRNYFSARYIGSEEGSMLELPDLVAIANAFGIQADAGKTVADLQLFFSNLEFQGPALLDFRLIKDESLSPKVSALPQPNGSILSMPLEDMSPLLSLEDLKREMLVPLSSQSLIART